MQNAVDFPPTAYIHAFEAIWERLIEALGEERENFENALFDSINSLPQPYTDEQLCESILDVVGEYTLADNMLAEAIERLLGNQTKSESAFEKGQPGYKSKYGDYVEVPVYFATDRAKDQTQEKAQRYRSGRGNNSNHLGKALISIPDTHKEGNLEVPSRFNPFNQADYAKHILVIDLTELNKNEFVGEANEHFVKSECHEVFVFIHGYNVSFENALCRMGQLVYDLEFDGFPIVYSWPSEASLFKYISDGHHVEWAQPHFDEFLDFVITELNASKIHLLAHSMGNRLLTKAIERLETKASSAPVLDQVVFAAPDLDEGVFANLAKAFPRKAKHFTLYASRWDLALWFSKKLVNRTAKWAGRDFVFVEPVENIDATKVNASLGGHGFFADSLPVIKDVATLIHEGKKAEERGQLEKAFDKNTGEHFWVLAG